MGQGLNLGQGYAAGAMGDELQEVLKQKYLEVADRRRARREQEESDYRRQQDVEQAKRWQMTHDRQVASDKALTAQRDAETAKDRMAADAAAARAKELQALMSDPSKLASLPVWQRLVQLNQLGVGSNLNQHAVESPEEHSAHLKTDKDSEFGDWRRKADYTEGLQRSRPAKVARLVMDDPALPRGVQSHLVAIRSRQPNFEAALSEFQNSIEAHRQAHPRLSDMKAVNALRQLYTGAGRGSDGGGNTPAGGQSPVFSQSGDSGAGSGRAPAQSSAPASGGTVKMRAPDGSLNDVPADQVEHYKRLGAKVAGG